MRSASRSSARPIIIVQGGQWGSEAKGAVAGAICINESVDVAVRTGAVNAGHTVEYRGELYKCQQLPVGWVNPSTFMVIGAGALIHPHILDAEIRMVAKATHSTWREVVDRLLIDRRAAIHLPEHTDRSTASGRHHAIGATGKGCSEALTDRVKRRGDPTYHLFADTDFATSYAEAGIIGDTASFLNQRIDHGGRVLLEGTQGTLLDLNLGPYPYTTHKPTVAGQWAVEAGLSPALDYDVALVMRTCPIRVAGNSGPMPGEISWMELARSINRRLKAAGLPPRVKEESIQAFELALKLAGEEMWWRDNGSTLPAHDAPSAREAALNHHLWNPEQRRTYQAAVSELNRMALNTLPEAVVADLSNLFELTTVTRKLRRVATWNDPLAREAAMLNRPARVALTFLNYLEPALWGLEETDLRSLTPAQMEAVASARAAVFSVESVMDTPVSMVSTGPNHSHIFSAGALWRTKAAAGHVAPSPSPAQSER